MYLCFKASSRDDHNVHRCILHSLFAFFSHCVHSWVQVYANGIGVPADNNTALHHFKKGSENVCVVQVLGLVFLFI